MTTITEERVHTQTFATPRTPALAPGGLPDAGVPTGEYLSFRVGGEEYGIDILRVNEIRSYEQPTRIANASTFIKGVVNLRGLIVPIVDLRMMLGCSAADYTDLTVVIVLNVSGRVIGVVADSVSDVVRLSAKDIKPAPQLNSSVEADYITGMGCLETGEAERMLILVDIEAMLGNAMGLSR